MFNFVVVVLLLNVVFCFGTDPIIVAGALGFGFLKVGNLYNTIMGNEYCDKTWIDLDVDGLHSDLQANVFGQHLMQKIVVRILKAHFTEARDKALVLSFHGPTGTGKNLVSSFIAKNLFKEGSKSQYFHLYLGSRDLAHQDQKREYMEKLKADVEKATKNCERNLFVFDEVDKMVPGVLDALSPYIDFHQTLDGVDYRKNIFIFLSNAGAKNITKLAMKFREAGKKREDIRLKDVEFSVTRGAYHEIGGLYRSEIVNTDRIDIYVPFLPLEKDHIKDCIYAELKALNWLATVDVVNKIAEELDYVPEKEQFFARSGCRKVRNKVKLFADNYTFV